MENKLYYQTNIVSKVSTPQRGAGKVLQRH
jgi:hypothetical protein